MTIYPMYVSNAEISVKVNGMNYNKSTRNRYIMNPSESLNVGHGLRTVTHSKQYCTEYVWFKNECPVLFVQDPDILIENFNNVPKQFKFPLKLNNFVLTTCGCTYFEGIKLEPMILSISTFQDDIKVSLEYGDKIDKEVIIEPCSRATKTSLFISFYDHCYSSILATKYIDDIKNNILPIKSSKEYIEALYAGKISSETLDGLPQLSSKEHETVFVFIKLICGLIYYLEQNPNAIEQRYPTDINMKQINNHPDKITPYLVR